MKLAVLIDADNINPADAEEVFAIASRLGEVITRRAFGNITVFTGKDGWKEQVRLHAIHAFPQVSNIDRKNTADFALIIDAMDCLASQRYDGFVLVSSDSDFTSLAQRLRDDDKAVYGIGDERAPTSFRNACSEFFELTTREKTTDAKAANAPAATVEAPPVAPPPAKQPAPEPPPTEAAAASTAAAPANAATQEKKPAAGTVPDASAKQPTEFQKIVEKLQNQNCKKLATLQNALKTMKKPQEEIEKIINAMKKQKIISIDNGGKVTWK